MEGSNKKGSTLKMKEENGELMIQTEDLAMQIIFNSPILEVTNYHEQLEKYNYRAAISTINLKVDEFDDYYSAVRQRVDGLYNTLVYRSIGMIQDLLIGIRFAKSQLWREHTMVAMGLRSNLYMKNLDPYGFNPAEFQKDSKEVLETLRLPKEKLKEGRQTVGRLLARLKEVEAARMEDMFSGRVVSPYVAENREGVEVDPSAIYRSYLTYLQVKMERADESLFRRHFSVHEEVIKFGQAVFEHNIKFQKNASSVIRRYCDSIPSDFQTSSIAPTIKMSGGRQIVDADELVPGRQLRSESRPALVNRNTRVQFRATNRVLDLETMREETVEQIENEERQQFDKQAQQVLSNRESPFESFTERRRVAYKDYYQQREFQKKLREEEIRQGYKDIKDREKERVIVRRIIRANPTPPPWAEFVDYESPFLYFMQSRVQKEVGIWDINTKYVDKDRLTSQLYKKDKGVTRSLSHRSAEQKNKPESPKKIEKELQQNTSRQQAIAFQDRRCKEQQARLARLKFKMVARTYENFMAMSKMQVDGAKAGRDEIRRYGMRIRTELAMNDLSDLDRFFYYYYKERYYKENQWIRDNADNPIIFLDPKKVSMSSAPKTVSSLVSSLVKRVHTMKYFLVWWGDIIVFRLRETKDRQIAEFQCYEYSKGNNCQKVLYELRRRTELQLKETIFDSYLQLDGVERVMSRVEVGHRLIFDRHKMMPTPVGSVMKGNQIAQQIFQDLRR